MAITEKKPLLIQIAGERNPNELPMTASAVGYDFVQGNYLIYSTGSDSWVTAPPNTAGIQEYWQSTVNNNIFTTGSIKVSGSVILGDASSDVVYISGSVTASNGLLVNGNLNVNGGVVTYGGTTVDGGTIVGQQFEDTDTSGNSYGLVIKNSGTGDGVPFLSFVQGATLASGFAGGIGGWTKAPSSGYIPGLNLSFYSSYPRIGIRNAAASTNIATFDANGLQVTGTVDIKNGGLRVAGVVPGISAPYNDTPVIIDLASGQQYGPVIRSVAGQYNFAALSLDQNGTYLGGIYGLENDPGGFGYVDGVNLYVNGANKKINFNVNSVSVGRFTSNGLQVTGSINGSSTITAATGFSGSLTKLTDGSPYLIAGNNVSITTGSNGAVTVNAITSSNFFRLELLDYEALSSVTSTTLGQVIFPANEYTGSLTLRGVISSNDATNTGSIQLYNVTSGAYVDIGGPGVKHLSVTGTIPTIIQSVNLISASGFSSSSQAIYELVASSSNALNTSFFGSFEIRPQGTFQLNGGSGGSGGSPGGSSGQIQYNNGGSFDGVTNLTWDGVTLNATGSFLGNLNGTASYATNAATASYVLNAVTASYATVAVSLTISVFNVALNGSANGVSTNIGGIYIPASTTVTTKSLAYIGGSTVSEVAVLKLVPINSVTVSASWVVTGTLTSVSLSNPVTLGPGWYDLTLETGTVSQTAFGRGLYLTSGDI